MSSVWRSLSRLWESTLYALGLANKEGSLLVLGLDNAGKTTLLHRLKSGDVRSFPPTDRPAPANFQVGRLQFQAWDLGGHEAVRYLWEDYVSTQVSAVLFLVDATDAQRLEEAAFELDHLIAGEKLLADIPIAILINKCDSPEALSTVEICQRLEYQRLEQEQGAGKMAVYRISVLKGEGYQQAFRWISGFL